MKAPTPQYIGPANKHGGSNNKPPNRVVIHCTVSPCCKGAVGIANYFKNTTKSASAHYVNDATTEVQCLPDSVVGFHAPPNGKSIGIEMCCSLSSEGKGHWSRADHQKMLRITARRTAALCLTYGLPIIKLTGRDLRDGKRGICGHADVRDGFGQTNHWDPGPYFPWSDFLRMVREAATELAGKPGSTGVITPPTTKEPVMDLKTTLIPRWTPSKGWDGKTMLDAAQQLNQARGFAQDAYAQASAANSRAANLEKDLAEVKALVKQLVAKS